HKHFITCFIEDNFGLQNLHFMNEDMVTWESDYPHSDCTWPESHETVWAGLKHLTRQQIDKVTHLNAMREFSYDPFSILGRENCTDAALRAKSTHFRTDAAPGSVSRNANFITGQTVAIIVS